MKKSKKDLYDSLIKKNKNNLKKERTDKHCETYEHMRMANLRRVLKDIYDNIYFTKL